MALSFFEDSSTSSRKPFLEAYLESHPEIVGELYEIKEISATRAKEGYLLNAGSFVVYIRNSNKTLGYLLQALEVWVEDLHGYGVFLQVTSSHPYYKLATDSEEERNWIHTKGKYTVLVQSTAGSEDIPEEPVNPFLVPSPVTLLRRTRKPKDKGGAIAN